MKATIDSSALKAALDLIGPTIGNRTSAAVLQNAHLVTSADAPGKMQIYSHHSNMWTSAWIPAGVAEHGEVAVAGKQFTEHVRFAGDSLIALETVGKKLHVQIGRSGSHFSQGSTSMWSLDDSAYTLLATMPASTLSTVIERVLYAAHKDENARPILNALRLVFDERKVQALATDGYQLAIFHVDFAALFPIALHLPRAGCLNLDRILQKMQSSEVKIFVEGDRSVLFAIEQPSDPFVRVEFFTTTVDGKYPDTSAIIPKSSTMQVTVEQKSMIAALKTIFLFSRENANIVRMHWDPGLHSQVVLFGTSSEFGDAKVSMPAMFQTIQSQPFDITFDAQLLLEALTSIGQVDEITFEFTQPTRPGIIFPKGTAPGSYINLLMPMHPPR